MFSNELFEWVDGRRVREVDVSVRGYELALGLLGKHLELPSAQNVHYKNDVMYAGLLYLSIDNTYAQTAMTVPRLTRLLERCLVKGVSERQVA